MELKNPRRGKYGMQVQSLFSRDPNEQKKRQFILREVSLGKVSCRLNFPIQNYSELKYYFSLNFLD